LLEEQLSIEYEDIVDKITDKIENFNEIPNKINNFADKNFTEKKEKAQQIEKNRKFSLFSENVLEDNQIYSPSIDNIEKNIKINLVIKENINTNCNKNNSKKKSKKGDDLFSFNLKIDASMVIYDLIKIAVDTFNERFRNDNYKYLLSNRYNNYKLKASKKNGFPNVDIPGKFILIYFF